MLYTDATHAMSRLKTLPTPARIKLTRTSFSALARRAPLSYFSYTTGTKSMNKERNMPEIDTKRAKPVRPAATQKPHQ